MRKGIVLFDIQDFLYQGLKEDAHSVDEINRRQTHALDVLHRSMSEERGRRLSSKTAVPTVEQFLPTGDGYYLLCRPELGDILDISICIMAMLDANDISAYCVAHIGDVNVFKDMTGRENATGFDLGFASRLQAVSQSPGKLVCSDAMAGAWRENQYFELEPGRHSALAKDGVEYQWRFAVPTHFEASRAKFKR